MTKDQFLELSYSEQEKFIEEGGIIQKEVPTITSPVDPSFATVETKEQVGATARDEVISLSSSNDSVREPESHQPAQNLLQSSRGSEPSDQLNRGKWVSNDATSSESEANTNYSEGFAIDNPVELLFLLDDDIRTSKVTLHDWQFQFLMDFASGGLTDKHPFQALMRACNGSGKDKYIIAPCVVWLCMRYKMARAVVTSSSGVQLDNQTCTYISMLCEEANRKFGKVWKVNYRYYECLATQAPIICYATDEPGKAEGFHPLKFGAKMVLAVSEDKTVPDDINVALNKCSGYTHRIHVSTPGNVMGHFYEMCQTAIMREAVDDLESIPAEDYIQYLIPFTKCPHISPADLARGKRDLPGGENGAAFKSQFLAEFSAADDMVVLPYTFIWKTKKKPLDDWKQESHNKGGLDLSDGGDETALAVRNGNRLIKVIPFRFDNTEDTIAFLEEKFRENDLDHPEALIFGDCVGMGKPLLDRLRRLKWSNIRYIDSRAKPRRPSVYNNWGTEQWFNFAEWVKKGELLLFQDDLLFKQLAGRRYKLMEGKHKLLGKPEQKSKGYPSPDRADAVVMAFTDYESAFEGQEESIKAPFQEKEEVQSKSSFTLKSWADGSSRNWNKAYNVNSGNKDFGLLEEQLADYNREILRKK